MSATAVPPAAPSAGHRPCFTKAEILTILRVSNRTLDRAIAEGKIRTVRVRNHIRIPASEVDRLLNTPESDG